MDENATGECRQAKLQNSLSKILADALCHIKQNFSHLGTISRIEPVLRN